jgi:hypothetical protein
MFEKIFHLPVEVTHFHVDFGHSGPHPTGATALESVVNPPDPQLDSLPIFIDLSLQQLEPS